jgi:putative nucleotidyltransferase-like protein
VDVEAQDSNMADALRLAAYAFKVDQVTAEVTAALDRVAVPTIVVKGPAIATWLYASDQPRLYNDTDLLVREADWERTMEVLRELGFEDDLGPLDHPRMESGAGYPWRRSSDGTNVDLHYTLFGVGAEPEKLWVAFHEQAVRENVGGAEVCLPSRPARLLHIALHAVQHGGETWEKPMMDLEQGIAKAPQPIWIEARQLAERLDAAETFAAGIRLTAAGRDLASTIGAEQGHTVDAALRLDWVPTAEGFRQLSQTRGLRRRLAIVLREAFPSRAFMRWWSPLARRGNAGLVLAYCWRPLWLAYRAVPGYLAWRRIAQGQRRSSQRK